MAVVNTPGSLVMALLNASPQQLPPVSINGARLRVAADRVAVNSGDSVNSVYWVARLPSKVRLFAASMLHTPALAGTATPKFQVGLFNPPGRSFITDNASAIHDGIAMNVAGAFGVVKDAHLNAGKRLWEFLGLSEAPDGELDIRLTLTGGPTTAAGSFFTELVYGID